jgi:hypothetical protein
MRSTSSPLGLAALVLATACGSEQDLSAELRDFAELERSLNAVSAAVREDRALRIDELEQRAPQSPAVRRVHQRCLAAYRAFAEAEARMEVARRQVGRIEAEAQKKLVGPVDLDASAADLSALHGQAVDATEELSTALDRAESLVSECTEARTGLAERLGAR